MCARFAREARVSYWALFSRDTIETDCPSFPSSSRYPIESISPVGSSAARVAYITSEAGKSGSARNAWTPRCARLSVQARQSRIAAGTSYTNNANHRVTSVSS